MVATSKTGSTAVSISMSDSVTYPPYCSTVAVTVDMDRLWPSGVTPSVRGVVISGRVSHWRNSMVLPPFLGMGCFCANRSCTNSGSTRSIR